MTETQTGEPFAALDTFLRVHNEQDQLIEALHVAQGVFGYLSEEVLLHVARALRLPPSRVAGAATFYHLFRFDPPGEHTCIVCAGTACFVKGADAISEALSQELGIPVGDTTADGQMTLGEARCLGSCGLAPVVVVDGEVLGHQSPESALVAMRAVLAGPPGAQADESEPATSSGAPR